MAFETIPSTTSKNYIQGRIALEQFGLDSPLIKEFAKFPWQLHRGDPCWTPPLNAELLGNRILGVKGLLTSEHPYHRHAEVTHFLARRNGSIVGRISAAINHRFNQYHNERIGFFGFFDVENDCEAASALLDGAKEWLASKGMLVMRGPGEYSNATHERQGVLVDGYNYLPTVELTHNPPYYAELLERYGLVKVKDYQAYLIKVAEIPIERFKRLGEAGCKRSNITTRPADMKRFKEDVRLIMRIYNEAWHENWGFIPVTDGEADSLADRLKSVADPGFVIFAYVGNQPAGVIGAIPDPNRVLHPLWRWWGDSDAVRLFRLLKGRRRIHFLRFMFFGILPPFRRLGIDALLFAEAFAYGVPKGYTYLEASMLLEENSLMIAAAKALGGQHYKTWRVYQIPLPQSRTI
jgi:hypothetical protein